MNLYLALQLVSEVAMLTLVLANFVRLMCTNYTRCKRLIMLVHQGDIKTILTRLVVTRVTLKFLVS